MLDIFVRTGMNKSSELVPQLDLLKKISDTLGCPGPWSNCAVTLTAKSIG